MDHELEQSHKAEETLLTESLILTQETKNQVRERLGHTTFSGEPARFGESWILFWMGKRQFVRFLLEEIKTSPDKTVSDFANWLCDAKNRAILTEAFYSKGGFWKRLLEAFEDSRKQYPTLPVGREGFRFRLDKIGIDGPWRPRSMAMVFGNLKPETAGLVDERGRLTVDGLKHWCHNGYTIPDTGEKVYGKDILISAYKSGRFWPFLKEYSDSLTSDTCSLINGIFPLSKLTFAEVIAPGGNRSIEIGTVFGFFGLEIPRKEEKASNNGNLSDSALLEWCHNGYIDPDTGSKVYGKDILEQAYVSGNFWVYMKKYAQSLSPELICSIGGIFPSSHDGFERRLQRAGIGVASIENIFTWFDLPLSFEETDRIKKRKKAPFRIPENLPREARIGMRMFATKLSKVLNDDTPTLSVRAEDFRFTKGRYTDYTVRTLSPKIRECATKYQSFIEDELILDFRAETGTTLRFEWMKAKKRD